MLHLTPVSFEFVAPIGAHGVIMSDSSNGINGVRQVPKNHCSEDPCLKCTYSISESKIIR